MKLTFVRLLLAVILGLISFPLTSEAKHRGVVQIGILWPVGENRELGEFREALRDLGYIEGQNFAYEYRSSRGDDATKRTWVGALQMSAFGDSVSRFSTLRSAVSRGELARGDRNNLAS